MKPSRHTTLWCATAAMLSLHPVVAAPEISSISLTSTGKLTATFPTETGSFYILTKNGPADLASFTVAEDIAAGTGAVLALTSRPSTDPRAFYRVEEFPLTSLHDADGDGMPDAFELGFPGALNPLAADGSLDYDGDGLSNRVEYDNGTSPVVPNPPTNPGLVINEVDYDQLGTDTAEFVEILNKSSNTVSLSGLSLAFINGSGNVEYKRIDLTPVGSLAPGQYLVVGAPSVLATLPLAAARLSFPTPTDNTIQNGAPDGIALIHVASSTVFDALSYEGPMTAAQITGFPTTTSLVEGSPLAVGTADSNTAVGSLGRLPNGMDTDNAAIDWNFSTIITPGLPNVP